MANDRQSSLYCFEIVWQTINEKYFDPIFGGLDWNEVHERYRPMIAAASSDHEFYKRLNYMLIELHVSHITTARLSRIRAVGP